jgi:dolichol-phosphate mannosyltransferase
MQALSVVVPTYEEKPVVVETLRVVRSALENDWPDAELLVIDDESLDGTAAAVRTSLPDVRVHVRDDEPADLGQSVLDGLRRATGTTVLVMDADGQHPPERAPAVVRPVTDGDADISVGVRKAVVGAWPRRRRLLSFGATALARLLAPAPAVSDPMSGFFAVRRDAVADALATTPSTPIGYKVLLELLAAPGVTRTTEVGYRFRQRRGGESNLDTREYYRFLRHLLSLRLRSLDRS